MIPEFPKNPFEPLDSLQATDQPFFILPPPRSWIFGSCSCEPEIYGGRGFHTQKSS